MPARTIWTLHTAGQLVFGRNAVGRLGELAGRLTELSTLDDSCNARAGVALSQVEVLLFKPRPNDVFHFLAIQRLVGEKIVDDRRKCSPVILSIKQSVELYGSLFEVRQAFVFGGNQNRRGFARRFPIRGPLGNLPWMVGVACVDHFGHGSSQRNVNRLFAKLAVTELVERPFHLDVGVALGTIVPIRLDRHRANAGSNINRHEGMAGFVVRGDLRHVRNKLSRQTHVRQFPGKSAFCTTPDSQRNTGQARTRIESPVVVQKAEDQGKPFKRRPRRWKTSGSWRYTLETGATNDAGTRRIKW